MSWFKKRREEAWMRRQGKKIAKELYSGYKRSSLRGDKYPEGYFFCESYYSHGGKVLPYVRRALIDIDVCWDDKFSLGIEGGHGGHRMVLARIS